MVGQDGGSNDDLALDEESALVAALAQNEKLLKQVEELTEQVEKLTRELNKNSTNSNKPPSSDNLGKRRSIRKPKKPTGKKRGGQLGHKGHSRKLLAPEHVDRIVDVFPDRCEMCQEAPPQICQARPWRHQVVELLGDGGGRHVVEYRGHRVLCKCGTAVAAPMHKVPSTAFGPRLSSVVSVLSGHFQISRRQVVVMLEELFGIRMSLGSVSNIEGRMSDALAGPSDEALARVEIASFKHVDETSWIRDFERCSVWVFATGLVSVFRIVANGSRKQLRKHLKRQRGILVSDRAAVFLYWKMGRRQICWSHLLRVFVDFSQRDGPGGRYGRALVSSAELVFIYWRHYQAKALARGELVRLVSAVRDAMKPYLERAMRAGIAQVSGPCANILAHWEAMWAFLDHPGVEPSNNHAERELRRLVLWRKRCFGSQSNRGDRYVERMMTVTHTLRKQRRNILDYLHQCFLAKLAQTQAPSLLAAG